MWTVRDSKLSNYKKSMSLQDENGVNRPVCSYVRVLRAGRLLESPRQAARFVSLLAHEKAPVVGGGGGKQEQWCTLMAFLCRGKVRMNCLGCLCICLMSWLDFGGDLSKYPRIHTLTFSHKCLAGWNEINPCDTILHEGQQCSVLIVAIFHICFGTHSWLYTFYMMKKKHRYSGRTDACVRIGTTFPELMGVKRTV